MLLFAYRYSSNVSSLKHEKGVTLRPVRGVSRDRVEKREGWVVKRVALAAVVLWDEAVLKLMNSCPRRKRNNPLFRQFALPYNHY